MIALACVVVFVTTYALILPAITMSEETYCGQEEHTHTAECYEKVLVCGLEESQPHQHTEACYQSQSVLVCGQEETEGHTHSQDCYDEEGQLICGKEETEGHTHSQDCYETQEVLVCGQGEGQGSASEGDAQIDASQDQQSQQGDGQGSSQGKSQESSPENSQEASQGHTHTEACYEERLICGKEEHVHHLSCYSNPNADLETAEVWERTLPQLEGKDWAEDLISVAHSQLGYTESSKNYQVAEDNSILGYTRYGAWYGDPYGDWCAMFASFCLNYAGISQEEIPYDENCQNWIQQLSQTDQFGTAGKYEPKAGDLVFFDMTEDDSNAATHVGIVTEVSLSEEGQETSGTSQEENQGAASEEVLAENQGQGSILKTIEGNSEDQVAARTYELTDSRILGYGILPVKEIELSQCSKTATIYKDDSYTEKDEKDGTVITLTGLMPEEAEAVAYPKEVDLDGLVCAYDITIRMKDGTAFEPSADNPISVTFQLSQQTTETETEADSDLAAQEGSESLEGMTVYYIPEEGEAQPLSAETDGDGITFQADHFSVYALAAATTVTNQNGLINAFNTAKNNGGGTIQLGGNITITTSQYGQNPPMLLNSNANIVLDLNGYHITMSAARSLFTVSSGTLTIIDSAGDSSGRTGAKTFSYKVMSSAVTDGAKGATQESTQTYTVKTSGYIQAGAAALINLSGGSFNLNSGLLCEGTNRALNQTGGIANLNGGYINGFVKSGNATQTGTDNFGGAVLVSGGTLNVNGSVLCNNKALNGGAIYNKNATVTITAGVLSQNTSTRSTSNWNWHSEGNAIRCGGGGIYADGASTTTMSGGYLTYNTVTDTGYFDGGGGIFFSGTSTFTFSGGYITGNTANGGGGIRSDFRNDPLNQQTTFLMTGGFLSGNTANGAEGGGANLDRNCNGTVIGGYVTNNQCTKGEHWGGGGIFCADGATLNLKNALITQNRAGGFGAGVGGCSTGRLYLYVDKGCAIYDNTDCISSDSPHYATGGAKEDGDVNRVKTYPAFLQNGHADFFCALTSAVTGEMLGNNGAGWQGTADGKAVSLAKDDIVSAKQLMGLTAHPTAEAKTQAEALAQVYINGNYAYTHGGGIMCNGNLVVGEPKDVIKPAYLALKADKELLKDGQAQSLEDKTFTFDLTDADGAVVATGTTDASGAISFNSQLSFKEAGTYTYYLMEEADGSDASVEYDTCRYRITVTVVRDSGTPLYGETTQYTCSISKVTAEISTDEGKTWKTTTSQLADSMLTLHKPGGGSAFLNKEKDVVELPVRKVWTDDQVGAESIEVILYKDDTEYDRQTLNKTNDWSYTWTKLEKGPSYRVEEVEVKGYITSYETGSDGTVIITNTKKEEYLLPETGGRGTGVYLLAGGLLLGLSLCTGYVRMRRSRKKGA